MIDQKQDDGFIDITDFYDHFDGYDVIYQGKVIRISDRDLGALDLQSSEHTLITHLGELPAHAVRGIIGDLTRYYKNLVRDQKEVVAKAEDKVYARFKSRTVGQIYNNSGRNATESGKPPTDRFIQAFLRDDLEEENDYLEPREDIRAYQEAKEGYDQLLEVYERLQNSLQIVTDTLKVAVTLNVNERERDKAQNYVNGTQTRVGSA